MTVLRRGLGRPRAAVTAILAIGVLVATVGGATALHARLAGGSAGDQVATFTAPAAPGSTAPPAPQDGRAAPPRQSSRPPARLTLAVLGDSVPAGSACGCPGFGDVYGSRVADATDSTVTVNNLGTPRLTSTGLLSSLAGGRLAARVVARADIITITVGANDFHYGDYDPATCAALSCYTAGLQALRSTMDAVLDRIADLRGDRPTAVRVTGYWNIWQDGAVGRSMGPQFTRVGDALTQKVNAVLAASAAEHQAGFVDLFGPFRGAGGDDDDTDLLAGDGDHPNQVGHDRIAAALVAAGLSPLD